MRTFSNSRKTFSKILNKLRASFKIFINDRVYVLIFSIATLLVVFGLVLVFSQDKASLKDSSENTVKPQIVTAKELQQSLENSTKLNDPKNSSACQLYSLEQIESTVKETVNKQFAGIVDTKTPEGSISSCSYRFSQSDSQQIKSLQVLIRNFSNEQQAMESFMVISKYGANNIDSTDNQTFILANNSQLLSLNQSTIITINIVKQKTDVNTQEILLSLSKHL